MDQLRPQHHTRTRLWHSAAGAWMVLLATGCRPTPDAVVRSAREALPGGTEAVLPWLAADARALLEAEPAVRAASGKVWKVTPDGKLPPGLLPAGEVVRPTVVGARATVVVARGKQQRSVLLRREDGHWRIDLLAMPDWWDHIRPK